MIKAYQIGAIPLRRSSSSGGVEVMLVTTRGQRRWMVPKGWPWPDTADHDAAAGEAWEEAGVRGRVSPEAIGSFTYAKVRKGVQNTYEVVTYLLEVTEVEETWPESSERRRDWFSASDAAALVLEPGLKDLLEKVQRMEITSLGS